MEVKIDDGPWQAAKLDDAPQATHSWVSFSIAPGRLKAGKHTIVSRAIDMNDRIQPSAEDDEIALK